MGGKDLEVKVISKGLKVIAPQKTKSGVEAFNVLQHFTDFMVAVRLRQPLRVSTKNFCR